MTGDSRFLYGANVHANGIRQHYLRYGGEGQPLVLIPGITSPAVTWGFVADALAARHDVYVLDVRGRGLSSTGPDLSYDLDSYAADGRGFIDALGLSDVVLTGHSMGARIAIRLARADSRALARLVLVDPPVSGPGRRPYPAKLEWYTDSIRLARGGMTAEDMKRFCPTWTEEQRALRAEWLHTCDELATRISFEKFHTEDIHQDLPFLDLPVTLMVATRGGVILPEDEAEILGLNPSIQITHVAEAGHMIPWDNLSGFIEAVEGEAVEGIAN
ncbi:alpha/beta fold hydrolase [Acidomonas methanolica]|uniref:Esterase/lipase n=1 Tax=Acidomonas methanolica NBRC 104435 TaxID=1231351 RepID=A0A023D357_ACIMT|nr:alpha/beta hydrolase [Acidomonas methanolica]MBU2654071.1 alpha/beta hydrolase [Acidomonas methanolica]TCS30700.1 N-formylmaleamate deformylase [Acidomonas methanolica]GAJ28170.1 esterase/lipase [Acidomonas methanolica NBRC 104435]GBQ50155.1 esterase [Acidomonas methanolica]GEK98912.1 alpha/beta hydrolase [Acidomonas methanolica NBRC 104435]